MAGAGSRDHILTSDWLQVVAELLATGMDINVRTSRGTALHEAALCGKVEVVRTLLEHGVNTAARDSEAR